MFKKYLTIMSLFFCSHELFSSDEFENNNKSCNSFLVENVFEEKITIGKTFSYKVDLCPLLRKIGFFKDSKYCKAEITLSADLLSRLHISNKPRSYDVL